jgi:hypothetical protein
VAAMTIALLVRVVVCSFFRYFAARSDFIAGPPFCSHAL